VDHLLLVLGDDLLLKVLDGCLLAGALICFLSKILLRLMVS
jgi:hypothetical protein